MNQTLRNNKCPKPVVQILLDLIEYRRVTLWMQESNPGEAPANSRQIASK